MRRWIFLLAVVAIVLLMDQVTKRIVVDSLGMGESIAPVPALADYFQITRSENTGSAFGFLPQAGDIFLVIAVVVVAAIVVFYARLQESARVTRLGMSLIVAGALGNALDRIEYGAVVDFIHYRIPGLVSNVSNLADHAIVLGVILVFIESWRTDRTRKDKIVPANEAESSPPQGGQGAAE